MSTQYRKYILLLITLAVSLNSISSCGIIDPERKVSDKTEYYAINETTILEFLAQGEKDVFVRQSPFDETHPGNRPVQWSQENYLLVAQTLHEFVWNESLENWNLHRMFFEFECKNLEDGPQNATFVYFKIDQESRFVSELSIKPQENIVSIHMREYQPQRVYWQPVDKANLKISANTALQISEQNGGAEIRNAVKNSCYVLLTLFPDEIDYSGWQVFYTSETGGKRLASFYLNPLTGNLEQTK